MTPVVDYALAEGRNFEPVEAGLYPAHLTKWTLVEKAGKYPYYNCEYTIDDTTKKVWDILSLHPDAMWGWKDAVLKMGANPDDVAPGSTTDTDDVMNSVLQAPIRLELSKVPYTKSDGSDGGLKNEVEKYHLPEAPAF